MTLRIHLQARCCGPPWNAAGEERAIVCRALSLAPSLAPSLALIAAAILLQPVQKAAARSPESSLCATAAARAERALRIPDGFLDAMSRVESGRPEPDGSISAWPWTVTAAGIGHYYPTRADAVAAVGTFRQQGILSIDVGCLQINLQQHPDAFTSLDQAFDPGENALYAGHFLLRMHDRMGSWPRAAAAYHSQTPGIGTQYQWKVLEAWAVPQDGRDAQNALRRNGQAAFASAPPFAHPAMAGMAGRQTVLAAAPSPADAGTAGAPARIFHPFQGFRHFSEPSLHRPAAGGMRGRTLASYRANPVALAAPAG
ncbi:lysozyme family protein [Nguyenibacter vanlangensis]|uniref:Lytic transglycosylase domain-containing protein n=1 Tax=Nguyenibacter vanlangensis TaxID=1216886 RepID=A0A7Y7IU68_9PROT|nr:lytic transglycosylase domain-containing protein [Nguyenibacter vanlangensis]NVN09871.1 lytic transglycosylase domain-containing protein [Nguyenibacter vanlangensis]